jgi:hypothetical protein
MQSSTLGLATKMHINLVCCFYPDGILGMYKEADIFT